MLANIPKDTKSFLTWLLYVASNPASYWKRFSRNKSPATTRVWSKISYGDEWTSSQTFNHFLCIFRGKTCFFSTSWKYQRLPIWLKTLNPKGYAAKYQHRKSLDVVRYPKYALAKREWAKRIKIKTFSAKNECNSIKIVW